MSDNQKYFPVNWIDGMKINKSHFIAQDNAWRDALYDVSELSVSPIRFGIMAGSYAGEDNFNVKISLDNQDTLRVTALSCRAVTPGGIRINLPVAAVSGTKETDGVPTVSFRFSEAKSEAAWWIVLMIHPFERRAGGNTDRSEDPPRLPFVLPTYTIEVVSDNQYSQYAYHPYTLTIGKIAVNGNDVRVDQDYIPPCISISAHPDLVSLHGELDQFMGTLEMRCSQIVQKIYQKKQQNEISELVQFLCDRMILYLGQALTYIRWTMIHESPASLFACIASLARVMKNSIDLRIGSGKEEMINYLTEWCELKQGELEGMLTGLANIRYDNNDINRNIQKVTLFVRVTARLFETLSKLEFIGKRKESGIFVKEERSPNIERPQPQQQQPKRRFFG